MKPCDNPLECPLSAEDAENPDGLECDLVLVETCGNISARCTSCGHCENFRLTDQGPPSNFAKGAQYEPKLVDQLREAAAKCAKERQDAQDKENAAETPDPTARAQDVQQQTEQTPSEGPPDQTVTKEDVTREPAAS